MKILYANFLIICFCFSSFAQNTEEEIKLFAKPANLYGTLLVPENHNEVVVLIIPGSGPTDRDGNSAVMGKNNSLKFLAEDLAKEGISSLRIDKRGVGKSMSAITTEADLRFDTYIDDVINWGYKVLNDKRFKKLVVAGHSEGSLIGMVAMQELQQELDILGYVSLAGAGYPIDEVLLTQLKTLPDSLFDEAQNVLGKFKNGETVDKISPSLISIFRPSVQQYMISWIKHNPQEEIKKVNTPILIINGTTDIQVSVDNAEVLNKSNPKSELLIIENMNHIFKNAPIDRDENIKTYSNPELKNIPQLSEAIVKFIKANL
jgi:pimeloyl-ACP methyl ester carboxylesterase